MLLGAVYITNCIITLLLDNVTSVEAFKRQVHLRLEDNNYLPDIRHLHAIGCKVYVNIPKKRRIKSAKLALHAEEGYLVGFESSKIYCIYLLGRA